MCLLLKPARRLQLEAQAARLLGRRRGRGCRRIGVCHAFIHKTGRTAFLPCQGSWRACHTKSNARIAMLLQRDLKQFAKGLSLRMLPTIPTKRIQSGERCTAIRIERSIARLHSAAVAAMPLAQESNHRRQWGRVRKAVTHRNPGHLHGRCQVLSLQPPPIHRDGHIRVATLKPERAKLLRMGNGGVPQREPKVGLPRAPGRSRVTAGTQ